MATEPTTTELAAAAETASTKSGLDVVTFDLTSFGGIYKSVVEQLKEVGVEGKVHRLSGLQRDLGLDSLDAVELVMSFEDGVTAARGEKFIISDTEAEGLHFPLQVAIFLADGLEVEVPADLRVEMETRREEIVAFLEKRGPEPTAYGGKEGIQPEAEDEA